MTNAKAWFAAQSFNGPRTPQPSPQFSGLFAPMPKPCTVCGQLAWTDPKTGECNDCWSDLCQDDAERGEATR